MTQHIEPVAWMCRDNADDEFMVDTYEPEVCYEKYALVRLSDAQAALAAAEERGRSEERERCASKTNGVGVETTPPQTHGAGIAAAQITMGRGLVDVSRIWHEGRAGILFRPRENHIPIGDEGELSAGEYWPVEGDVVIWIENGGGAQVVKKYLTPFLPPSEHVVGEHVDYPKILYVCETCFEGNNEACGNDRDRINITPDGRWLCEDCRDGEGIDVSLCRDAPKLYTSISSHLREACEGLSDDYMTSETHHPGWVLIPQSKFDAICNAITKEPTP